jgi:hypothetical protein
MFIDSILKLFKLAAVVMYIGLVVVILLEFPINFDLEKHVAQNKGTTIPSFKAIIDEMRPILDDLSRQNFFRYFRVDISRDCPFQMNDALCTAKTNCQLTCECPLDKLPQIWIKEDMKLKENLAFSPIKLYDVMKPQNHVQDPWSFDQINDNTIYVDLQTDREMFTGYQGQSIWKVIYEENCMNLSKQCGEDNLLYKIVSGMHASVSSHLSEFYVNFDEQSQSIRPNEFMYYHKVGAYPERLKNLAFAVQILLRAYVRYIDLIEDFSIDTGDFSEDMKTKQLLQRLSAVLTNIKDIKFNQDQIFGQHLSEATQKTAYLQYFRNITQVMDCVDCVKCKVYGKMQVLGAGVALRIMLKDNEVKLTRNELVAFVNTLNKWSESLLIIERMKQRLWDRKVQFITYITILFGLLLSLIWFFRVKIIGNKFHEPSASTKQKTD